MSVLTAPPHAAFTRQLSLPFAPMANMVAKELRRAAADRLLPEPPRGLVKAAIETADKPEGT
ncbi:MAG TPA: hypothetical protein VK439_13100 [Rubrivivax sp.]|nr:hypothetical protein [Rubrivivax sp.]